MQILSDFAGEGLGGDLVATIGAYDGLHRGHQHLLRALIAHAGEIGSLSGLITFNPHPRCVLHPELPAVCLTTLDEKARLLEEMGLDVLVVLRFTARMSRTPAREFVRLAVEHLRMRELWVGAGFALGRDREGDVVTLRKLAQELGFELRVVGMVEENGDPISSTRIRSLILEGRVAKTAELLGRPLTIAGKVIPDYQHGWCASVPSFHLAVRTECLLPRDGAYAVCALAGGQRYPAVLYIGARFGSDDGVRTARVCLLESGRELGRPDVVVELIQRLEREHQFDTEGRLAAQVGQDVRQVERILGVRIEGEN